MDSVSTRAERLGDRPPVPRPVTRPPVPVKIVIAGSFGVGKTTAVASISEIPPLTTEAAMTSAGSRLDDNELVPDKTTTTVAMDFGRVTIDESLKLYLFGTPGQERFGFMWKDLAHGALGALVIVDTRRLEDCFAAVDFFERMQLPFVVAVNRFGDQLTHTLDDVRWALAISDDVPVISFDARKFLSVRDALLVVLDEALRKARARRSMPAATSEAGPAAAPAGAAGTAAGDEPNG